MAKKTDKNKTKKNKNKKRKVKLICPLCKKRMKAKKLNDGYVVCFYCGLIVYKPLQSLEQINAPGFIAVNQKAEYIKVNL